MVEYTSTAEIPVKTWIGLLELNVFQIEIPLFVDDQSRFDLFKKLGINIEGDSVREDYGNLVSYGTTPSGTFIMTMTLDAKADITVIAHECSHVVDVIFDRVGIPPGIVSTEVRSYTLGYLVGQAADLLYAHHVSTRKPRTMKKPTTTH